MSNKSVEVPLNARHVEHNDGQSRNIALKGSVPKKSSGACAVHPSMTPLQKNAAGLGGMGHATASITDGGTTIAASSAAAPLEHCYGGAPSLKAGKAVAVSPGMRSRSATPISAIHAIGEAILNEAFSASDAATRQAHGRK
ncbi:MAG: hypothetical protein ABSA68_11650 [Xanthobacteraceae bacterium]|jgi:hypothetical protein